MRKHCCGLFSPLILSVDRVNIALPRPLSESLFFVCPSEMNERLHSSAQLLTNSFLFQSDRDLRIMLIIAIPGHDITGVIVSIATPFYCPPSTCSKSQSLADLLRRLFDPERALN